MIRSKKEYEMIKKHLFAFTESLELLEDLGKQPHIHSLLHKAQKDALQSQIDIFTDGLMEWEKSKVYSEDEAKDLAWKCFHYSSERSTRSQRFEVFNNLWKKLTE